jgi:peroxiredoxin
MKNFTISLLALTSLAAVAQSPALPAFSLKGTDGKVYSNSNLFTKPTVLLFLKKGCPHNPKAMADMNRLKSEMGSKVNFLAVCNVSDSEGKVYAKELGAKFVILADKDQKLISGAGAEFSLDIALISPKTKKVAKIWTGYNNQAIAELYEWLPKVGGVKPKTVASKYPKGTVSGCGF